MCMVWVKSDLCVMQLQCPASLHPNAFRPDVFQIRIGVSHRWHRARAGECGTFPQDRGPPHRGQTHRRVFRLNEPTVHAGAWTKTTVISRQFTPHFALKGVTAPNLGGKHLNCHSCLDAVPPVALPRLWQAPSPTERLRTNAHVPELRLGGAVTSPHRTGVSHLSRQRITWGHSTV